MPMPDFSYFSSDMVPSVQNHTISSAVDSNSGNSNGSTPDIAHTDEAHSISSENPYQIDDYQAAVYEIFVDMTSNGVSLKDAIRTYLSERGDA